MSAGLFWGACVWAIAFLGFDKSLGASAYGVALLPPVTGLYCLLGALLTRWIGYSPFVLGVAWMGVELALVPIGLNQGLLGWAESDADLLHLLARGLGYVVVAFVVAYVNASLVSAANALSQNIAKCIRKIMVSFRGRLVITRHQGPPFSIGIWPRQARAPPF